MPHTDTLNEARIERKLLAFDAKSLDDGTGVLEGYGSVKGNVDAYGDEIADGAYIELDGLVKAGFGAVGHDWYDLPVATIEEAREDAKGLFVKMRFHSTDEAQKARTIVKERLERGKSVGLSIGYFTVESAIETRDGDEVRVLKKIRVIEVSIVTVPANAEALATGVKSGPGTRFDDTVESALAALDDLASRLQWFSQNRKKGLSEKHVQAIHGAKARLDALLAAGSKGDGEGQAVDPEDRKSVV